MNCLSMKLQAPADTCGAPNTNYLKTMALPRTVRWQCRIESREPLCTPPCPPTTKNQMNALRQLCLVYESAVVTGRRPMPTMQTAWSCLLLPAAAGAPTAPQGRWPRSRHQLQHPSVHCAS